jgi:hypothetical protein
MHVARHAIPLDRARGALDNAMFSLQLAAKRLKNNDLSDLTLLPAGAVAAAAAASVLELAEPRASTMIRLAARAGGALWALANSHGAAVDLILEDGPVRIQGEIDPSNCDGFAWLRAYWLATLVRQTEICELLLATSLELVGPPRHTQQFELHWIEALRCRHRGQDPAPELRRALEATREGATELDDDWVSAIERPRLVVASHVFQGNTAAADEALHTAYEKHRAYWGSPSRGDQTKGWLSISLAALTVMARDAGMTLETTSDYAPDVG